MVEENLREENIESSSSTKPLAGAGMPLEPSMTPLFTDMAAVVGQYYEQTDRRIRQYLHFSAR
jgi:hypothetical protein